MIIVEGPDGAGKTVLIGQISKHYPQLAVASDELRRDELHKKNVRGRTYRAFSEELRSTRPLIHDRLFFSELVYGPILRGSCEFSTYEQELVINLLLALNVPIIMCLPPLAAVKHNIEQDPDHINGVAENLERIYASYTYVTVRLMNTPFLNTVRYDYTESDPSGLWVTLDDYLATRKEREY